VSHLSSRHLQKSLDTPWFEDAPRKQKNDRRDAELILKMLVEGRFPAT
jgi:hypothetical protein